MNSNTIHFIVVKIVRFPIWIVRFHSGAKQFGIAGESPVEHESSESSESFLNHYDSSRIVRVGWFCRIGINSSSKEEERRKKKKRDQEVMNSNSKEEVMSNCTIWVLELMNNSIKEEKNSVVAARDFFFFFSDLVLGQLL